MLPEKALLRDFDEDIFINYDHDDNQAVMENFKGFVDRVHEFLNRRLAMLAGEKPRIWRDPQIDGNEHLSETIVIKLSRTASLVCVLSPAYLKSKWCLKELKAFYERASENQGIKINNKSRIFKVVKTPIVKDPDPLEESGCPEELRSLLQESIGYEFFEFDNFSGKLREYWPEYGPEYLKKYLEKLEDLAQDINEFIKYSQEIQKCINNCVYLAETTPELNDERNDIRRTLQQHGYRVLPDENLPIKSQAYEEKVREYLDRCMLSIHLIGSDFTTINTNEEKLRRDFELQHQIFAERVRKQHELALNRSEKDSRYSRLIWMPTGLTPREPVNRDFLIYLQNDPAVQENAEILSGAKLEDLKTIIEKKLKVTWQESATEAGGEIIYVYCDMKDRDAAAQVKKYLLDEKYEVLLPFNDGDSICKPHTENVRLCDAILVLYGSFNTMEFKLSELKRINVNRGKRPLLAHGVYVVGPETDHKKTFDTNETLVMKCYEDFSPDSLKPFLEQLKQNKSAAV